MPAHDEDRIPLLITPCRNVRFCGKQLHGLNASGRAPAAWTRAYFSKYREIPKRGCDSVTVLGVVSAWGALSDRFRSLPFEDLFEPALRYVRDGFLVWHTVHRQWQKQIGELIDHPSFREAFAPNGHAPLPGERFTCPGQASTLERIARSKEDDFYHGELAGAMRHAIIARMAILLDTNRLAVFEGNLGAQRTGIKIHRYSTCRSRLLQTFSQKGALSVT